MTIRSRPTVHPVFATARFSRTERVAGRIAHMPASQVHAKVMGTTMTMCGQSALSWFKFWDIDFADVTSDHCPRCLIAVETRTAHDGR